MLSLGAIVWGVRDIPRAVRFWSQALDYRPKYPPSEDWAILVPREGEGFQLSLNRVTSEKARRHHMDLFADDQTAEVARLIALGAVQDTHWRYEDDADYVVLNDPDGNPFCVIQK
jgi:catechol 2,3-dioxygenase-like lactoylglutathione lyase family enzyme